MYCIYPAFRSKEPCIELSPQSQKDFKIQITYKMKSGTLYGRMRGVCQFSHSALAQMTAFLLKG